MRSEVKNCQNCKKDFSIEPEDFNFYEKIKVSPPTFCPWCRLVRRAAWRNERTLYKRTCSFCGKSIISTYPADTPFPVYCWDCWHGDKWDATSYGRDYDFGRPFFEQYKELLNTVPHFSLWQRNVKNSEYSNMVGESKNIYLSVSVVLGSEDVFYSKNIDKSSNILDCLNVKEGQSLYEDVEGEKNYNCQYLLLSRNCIDSYFLFDCVNCSNCFMSSNLRNKQFYFRNKKYNKDDYFKEISKINLGSRKERESLINEYKVLRENSIYRFANNVLTYNSTGNNLANTKNCQNCFDTYDAEDLKYCYRAFISFKDSMDTTLAIRSELLYEYITGAVNDYNVRFSYAANSQVRDAEYTHSCIHATNLFGCVGIRDKENVILNKVYSKEDFLKLRGRIIAQMNEIPYLDKKGRVYKYGEFFPVEISPYAYNETWAQEIMPLNKDLAPSAGYRWKDSEVKNRNITVKSENIPDSINEIKDEIIKEILECEHKETCSHQCFGAFRITPGELQFYKKHNVPLPNKCANCRYLERLSQVPLPKLYKRECMCDRENHEHEGKCPNEFETPYPPEHSGKVYCESCYNKEVY